MLKDIAAIVFTPAFAFSVLRIATPVLFVALGGIFASRAGIFNMALEGMMLISALTGVVVSAKIKMGILGGLKFGMDGYAELIGKAGHGRSCRLFGRRFSGCFGGLVYGVYGY